MSAEGKLIARWESARGRYFVALYHVESRDTYSYQADGASGYNLPFSSEAAAIAEIQRRVDEGCFSPSKMRRMEGENS